MDTVEEEFKRFKYGLRKELLRGARKGLELETEKLKEFENDLRVVENWKNETEEEARETEKLKEKIKAKIAITNFSIKQHKETIEEAEKKEEQQKAKILKLKKLQELKYKNFLELDEKFKKGRIKQEEYERKCINIHLELDDILEKIDEELDK